MSSELPPDLLKAVERAARMATAAVWEQMSPLDRFAWLVEQVHGPGYWWSVWGSPEGQWRLMLTPKGMEHSSVWWEGDSAQDAADLAVDALLAAP